MFLKNYLSYLILFEIGVILICGVEKIIFLNIEGHCLTNLENWWIHFNLHRCHTFKNQVIFILKWKKNVENKEILRGNGNNGTFIWYFILFGTSIADILPSLDMDSHIFPSCVQTFNYQYCQIQYWTIKTSLLPPAFLYIYSFSLYNHN